MKRALAVLCLSAVAFAASCTSVSSFQQIVGTDDYEIARHAASDGTLEIYQLRNGRSLRVTTQYERKRPFLGFQLQELNKDRAMRRGTKPYAGLLVTGTYPKSSAKDGSVLPDDVLLQVAGQDVVYLEQLAKVEATLRDQQEVPVRLLRGDEELDLTLRTNLLHEQVTDTDDILLESPPPSPRPYAGVNLRGIPKVWAERILGAGKNGVVVAEVEVGSPAWLAGIRGGDLVETMDGEPVPDVKEMSARVAHLGEAGQVTRWSVRREVGRSYDATIHLSDYSGSSRISIPIVFSVSNETFEDRWRVGLGLVMSNTNHYIADQQSRTTKTRNVFSALLGLIRVTTTPSETSVRLLWLIHFC